jgi:hypothetical protein
MAHAGRPPISVSGRVETDPPARGSAEAAHLLEQVSDPLSGEGPRGPLTVGRLTEDQVIRGHRRRLDLKSGPRCRFGAKATATQSPQFFGAAFAVARPESHAPIAIQDDFERPARFRAERDVNGPDATGRWLSRVLARRS